MTKEKFKELHDIRVNERSKEINGFTYLPWADALVYLYTVEDPSNVVFVTKENEQGPLLAQMPGGGFMVHVTCIIQGVERGGWYPVLDDRNNVVLKPTAMDINTSLQRARVKAIAEHGLGMHLYQGIDTQVPGKVATPASRPAPQPAPTVTQPAPKPTPAKPARVVEEAKVIDTLTPDKSEWVTENIDDAYIEAFKAELEQFTTVNDMMTWISSIVRQLTQPARQKVRDGIQEYVTQKTATLNKQ